LAFLFKSIPGLFLFFASVGALLAYAPLSLEIQAVLFLLGIAVPWVLFLHRTQGSPGGSPLWNSEIFPIYPVGFAVLWVGAAFFRFYHLTELSLWPLTDEAKSAYYALQLAQGADLKLLYDFSQLPPFYIWLEALVFKTAGASLFSLWFLPAFLSLLTVGAGYAAARTVFSKSFSSLLAFLLAFSFWPVYIGRFSNQGALLVLWELAVFGLAGLVQKYPDWKFGPFLLGLGAGLGFYTFISWATVFAVLTLWFFFQPSMARPWKKKLAVYSGGWFLALIPLGLACFEQDYGGYIRQVGMVQSSEAWLLRLGRCWTDPWDLFFRSAVPPNLFAYKAFWGGYLNPVLTAGFFIGLLELARFRSRPFVRFLLLAFWIFLLPGLWTGGIEMFRIVPVLPIVLGVAALGWASLVSSIKISRRSLAWALLFTASIGLDCFHLFGAYHSVWIQPRDNWFAVKSLERLRAYDSLQKLRAEAGPGYVVSELVPDLYDQSLELACFQFNAGRNPALASQRPRWTAVLTNIHYQPYLQKKFPEGKSIWLAGDAQRPDGGLMLEIIPLPTSNPSELARILTADFSMEGVVPLVFENRDFKPRRPVLEGLFDRYGYFKGDPFLESCFWEKIAENDYGDRDAPAQIAALRNAVQKGIPAAHLFNDLGALYFRIGDLKEAQKAYRQALQCPFNHTSAAAGLRFLGDSLKNGRKPREGERGPVLE
jgi:tetratricopeptide (TPR) repeat protein